MLTLWKNEKKKIGLLSTEEIGITIIIVVFIFFFRKLESGTISLREHLADRNHVV